MQRILIWMELYGRGGGYMYYQSISNTEKFVFISDCTLEHPYSEDCLRWRIQSHLIHWNLSFDSQQK